MIMMFVLLKVAYVSDYSSKQVSTKELKKGLQKSKVKWIRGGHYMLS